MGLINNGNYAGHVGGNVYNINGPMNLIDKMLSTGNDEEEYDYNPNQLPPHVEEPKKSGFWEGVKEFCARGLYIGGLMTLCLGFFIMLSVFLFFAWVIYSAYNHAQAVSVLETTTQIVNMVS